MIGNKIHIPAGRKIVILELQTIDYNYSFGNLIKHLSIGSSVTVLENLGTQKKKNVIEALKACDVIMFETTWLHINDMYPFFKILAELPKKIIYIHSLSNPVLYHLKESFSRDELISIDRHEIYEVSSWYDNKTKLIDLSIFRKEKETEQKKFQGLSKTGFKIRIGKVLAQGPAFSTLKEGEVVDELDCSHMDERPGWGVWVMGNKEPVKLINSDDYEEFYFEDLKAEAIIREIASKSSLKNPLESVPLLTRYLNRLPLEDSHFGVQYILDFYKVPRRKWRSHYEQRFIEYRNKYKHFFEK